MHDNRDRGHREEVVLVNLDEVNITDKQWERILRKDRAQVERLRLDYESGRNMVRVVLRPRCDGGYDIEDGRHRVIAAKLAEVAFIEALIVGD